MDDPAASAPSAPSAQDPFAPLEASPRGAAALVIVTVALAVLALTGGLAPLAGPLGMATGLVAHVKGHRLGMPATVIAGLATIGGMTVALYLR